MQFEKRAEKRRRISKITLLMLAADRSFHFVFGYILTWDLILLLFCILGRIPAAVCLLLLLLCSGGIFAFALHSSFRAKCGWYNVALMRALLKHRGLIQRLNGMSLTYRNGGWEHSDPDWLIRVNECSACILFAPDLDFSSPAVHAKQKLYDDFSRQRKYAETKEFHRYTFQLKEKSQWMVQLDRMDLFLQWVAAHNGRTVPKEMVDDQKV